MLTENMQVLTATEKLLCIYPYRDAAATKITTKTRNVMIIRYDPLGIPASQSTEAVEITPSYTKHVVLGTPESVNVFSDTCH